jgi:predicted nucleic acid-binding protein
MIVVSNTTPIVKLAAIGRLDLLEQLYGTILIPPAVYHEIVVVGAGLPGAVEVQTLPWFQQRSVTSSPFLMQLQLELDPGEAEAIALGDEIKADLILLDERRARQSARQLGLRHVGVLGMLIEAKQVGLIPAVKPLLDDLISIAGFWVGATLYAQVLRTAGE